MRCTLRFLILAAGLFLLIPLQALPARAQEPALSPEQQLVDRYVPIAYLRQQEYQCATPPQGGEPYLPLPVDIVLDNPRVLVRDAANGDQVLSDSPGAAELATYGPDTYLDFPGDPRRPGCTFETDERVRIEELGLVPTTYARIVFDEEEQRLALQYWFFWYFNDWNNTHEADWEMIQVMWDDVSGVDAALTVLPDRLGYSQHGGGELADWEDDKVQLEDDTHPRVFPAAGSHATFYANHTYLGWGENGSGFGCDVSTAPSVRTPLTALIVEENPDPNGPYSWLLYEGRWGERGPSVFNGVHGPAFNSRWQDPWGATDNWRTSSIVVPTSPAFGPTTTDAFCTLTEAGSTVLIFTLSSPWLALPAIAIVIAILAFFYLRSRDYFRRAGTLYREHWKVFVGIGLVSIPIGIVFNILQAVLIRFNPLKYLIIWFDDTAGARLSAVLAFGSVQQIATILIIAPAVIQAIADIQSGESPGVLRSYRLAAKRSFAIIVAALLMLVLAGIPLLTVIGFPIAIWLVVRWQYMAQALIFDRERSGAEALEESARLVRGRWWKTLFAVFIFDLMAVAPGILIGFGLLTLGGTAVGFANSISSLLFAVLLPLSVIAVTLMFLDRRRDLATPPQPGIAK